jgi:ribosomal protein S18 acetylase RimI-like enzyme
MKAKTDLELNSYHIRTFKKEDLQDVKNLIHHTISTCYPSIYSPEVVAFFINYHSEIEILRRASSGKVIVLVFDNHIRATGFLDGEELGGVYVHPDFQRKGFGKIIVEYLLKEAQEKAQKYIHLDSTPIAKHLYEKLEFSLVSPAVQMVGDVPLQYFKMEKYL